MNLTRRMGVAAAGTAAVVLVALAGSPALAAYSTSAQTQAALNSVDPSLKGDAKTAAVEAALESVLAAAIASGMSPTEAITEVTEDAVADGVSGTIAATAITMAATAPGSTITSADLGSGLGAAAASIQKSNDTGDAMQIASVVANSGPEGSQTTFSTAVTSNGGSTDLADAGGAEPQVASNGNGHGNGNGGSHEPQSSPNGNANGVNESCPSNNPSCNN